MKKTLLITVAVLLVALASPATAYVYINSHFNFDTVGANPVGWTIVNETSPPNSRSCRVVNGNDELDPDPPADIIQMLKFYDNNTNEKAINCSKSFVETNAGVVTFTCDLYFKQISALFNVRLLQGGAVGTIANSVAQITFEGNLGWYTTGSSGGRYIPGSTGPGNMSYLESTSGTTGSVLHPITDQTYAADTWYTLKIDVDCDSKTFDVFFGPKGGTLTPILTDTRWVYKTGNDPDTPLASNVQQVALLTSTCSTVPNPDLEHYPVFQPEGEETVYVDNVQAEGPVEPVMTDTVAEARLLNKLAAVNMNGQIVTMGNSQGFFYIQDTFAGGPGIRVRWPSAVSAVNEGDIVSLGGTIEQASDNGITTKHNGEREIKADYVTVNSSDNDIPPPIAMRNFEVGGGWYGPLETPDSHGDEPRLKGVWPMNTTPDPYYGDIANGGPAANSFSPLFNVGTLVTVCGKITDFCDQYEGTAACPDIYIYDGSLEFDGCNVTEYPPQGVRIRISQSVWDAIVAANSSTILNVGDYVSVTGVAGAISCSNLGSTSIRNIRLVRIRKASDFILVNDVEPTW